MAEADRAGRRVSVGVSRAHAGLRTTGNGRKRRRAILKVAPFNRPHPEERPFGRVSKDGQGRKLVIYANAILAKGTSWKAIQAET